MDYKKIYESFISSRRLTESELSEGAYFERHHIIPRSRGGNNNPDNLIKLTPEDHYFAHLLLARIYGGHMWAVLILMHKIPGQIKSDKKSRGSRHVVGMAKRKNALANKGWKHTEAAKKLMSERNIMSEDGRRRLSEARKMSIGKDSEETRYKKGRARRGKPVSEKHKVRMREFCIERGMNHLHKREIWDKAGMSRLGSRNGRYNFTKYCFSHESGLVEKCTKYELAEKYNLNRTCLNYVINGSRNHTNGWKFIGIIE